MIYSVRCPVLYGIINLIAHGNQDVFIARLSSFITQNLIILSPPATILVKDVGHFYSVPAIKRIAINYRDNVFHDVIRPASKRHLTPELIVQNEICIIPRRFFYCSKHYGFLYTYRRCHS